MAIRLLSSENVQGNIDIALSQNAISYLAVTNDNTGVAANARVQVVGESAQLDMIATSAGYTGVTGWADSGIISTDSGASGGLKLNSQSGGIQLQAGTTSYVTMDGSGYVGINMSPDTAVQLSVSGAIGPTNGTEAAPTHTFYGDPDTGMFRSGANTLGFSTGGTTRLSVRAAGIDVVGETETDSLKVTGTTEFTGGATFGGNIIIYNSSNAPYIDFVENGDLSDSKARITMDQIDTDNATLRFSTEGGGTLSEKMRIDENGNVAIQPGGATLTNTRLYVVSADNYDPSLYDGMGGIRISSGGSSSVGDGNYTGGIGFAIASGTSGIAGVQNGPDGDRQGLAFFTHPSTTGGDAAEEKMRIDADGNVTIGNSTYGSSLGQLRVINDAASSPASLSLFGYNNVADNTDFAIIEFAMQTSGTGGNVLASIKGQSDGTSENAADLRFGTANSTTGLTEKMRITSGGDVGIGTTTPSEILHTNKNSAGNIVGGYFTNSQANTGAEQVSLAFGLNRSGGDFVRQVKAITFGAEQQWTGTPSTVDGFLSFSTVADETVAQRMRIDSGGSVIIGAGATSGTPAADYRSLEIGRQGNTITGAPWKSNLYLTCNATITGGSTAFSYRYANEAPARMDLEDGNITFYNAAAGTVGNTISWSQKMIINSLGNVGIGSTAPVSILELKDDTPTLTISDTGNNYNDGDVQAVVHLSGRWYSGESNPNADDYSDARIVLRKNSGDGTGGSSLAFETSANGAGGLTEAMRIDKSQNVGIGTGTTNIVVTGKGLGIQNIGQDTTASMRLTGHNATGNPGVATYTELKHYGADLKFGINHNGGTDVITINPSKDVGINNTNPSYKLDVESSSDSVAGAYIQAGKSSQGEIQNTGLIVGSRTDMATNDYLGISFTGNASTPARGRAAIGVKSTNGNTAMDLVFMTRSAADGSQLGSADEKMRIKSNGRVGINTTNPLELLNVHQTTATAGLYMPISIAGARYQADYAVGIAFRPENNSSAYAAKTAIVGSGGGYGYNMADLHFCLNQSSTITDEVTLSDSRMTIKKSGNVGIGTTNPQQTLDVTGTFAISNNTTSYWDFDRHNTNGTLHIADTGTDRMSLTIGGTLTVSGDVVAYGSPSDKRYKENIKPITNALDKVSKLQGVTFDWKENESILDIKEDIGFIAQDVQKVVPELVRENEDGKLSLREKGIVPILVEAIKELKAEIEDLKKNK